jgi:hypothetical protein
MTGWRARAAALAALVAATVSLGGLDVRMVRVPFAISVVDVADRLNFRQREIEGRPCWAAFLFGADTLLRRPILKPLDQVEISGLSS